MTVYGQMTIAEMDEASEETGGYREWLEDMKPKKTTDDCYTPPNVYDAVRSWAVAEYGLEGRTAVRPFYPGGDYERFDYPDGCVVIDNPPFSIISKIVRFYNEHGIDYFLFAPYLTNFSTRGCNHIVTDQDITYANGAAVNTAFVTNLGEWKVRTAPALAAAIEEADMANRAELRKELPKYAYPDCVLTSTMVGRYGKYGVDFRLRACDCLRIAALDSQRAAGKAIFGSGYLLSKRAAAERAAAERAAAERAAAHVWELSDRERELQRLMGGTR